MKNHTNEHPSNYFIEILKGGIVSAFKQQSDKPVPQRNGRVRQITEEQWTALLAVNFDIKYLESRATPQVNLLISLVSLDSGSN
jgi:hypothetical protein